MSKELLAVVEYEYSRFSFYFDEKNSLISCVQHVSFIGTEFEEDYPDGEEFNRSIFKSKYLSVEEQFNLLGKKILDKWEYLHLDDKYKVKKDSSVKDEAENKYKKEAEEIIENKIKHLPTTRKRINARCRLRKIHNKEVNNIISMERGNIRSLKACGASQKDLRHNFSIISRAKNSIL